MKEAKRVGPHCLFSRHTAGRGPRRECRQSLDRHGFNLVTDVAVRIKGPSADGIVSGVAVTARCTRGNTSLKPAKS